MTNSINRKSRIILITILLITICILFSQIRIVTAEENPILNKGTISYTGSTNYMSYNVFLTAHGITGNCITDHSYYKLYMQYASFKRIFLAPAFNMKLDVVVKLDGVKVDSSTISKTISSSSEMTDIIITSFFYGYGEYEVTITGTITATATANINRIITYRIEG